MKLHITALVAAIAALAAASAMADSSFSVVSTLDGKTVLPVRIRWIATTSTPSTQVSQVKYLIDGRDAWT